MRCTRTLIIACTIALSACSSNKLYLHTPHGPSAVTPGTQNVGGSVEVRGGSYTLPAILLNLGLISLAIHGSEVERGIPIPEPDPRRLVVEHDCTQPLGDFSGNLRCR